MAQKLIFGMIIGFHVAPFVDTICASVWSDQYSLRIEIFLRHKCTFSPYILAFFYFGPYILILSLLVPKPINVCYFHLFCQSTK